MKERVEEIPVIVQRLLADLFMVDGRFAYIFSHLHGWPINGFDVVFTFQTDELAEAFPATRRVSSYPIVLNFRRFAAESLPVNGNPPWVEMKLWRFNRFRNDVLCKNVRGTTLFLRQYTASKGSSSTAVPMAAFVRLPIF